MRRGIAVLAVLMATLGVVSSASASSGEFTRALADPTWTKGSLAGSATWTDCQQGFPCKWLPYVSVQPSLPSYACHGDELIEDDPNVRIAWTGGNQSTNSMLGFDLPSVNILHSVQGQRVCLSAIYGFWRRDPVCVATAPVFGDDPEDCPFEEALFAKVLTSKFLEIEPPPAPPPPPAPTAAPVAAPPTKPKPKARHCPKGKRKVHRNGRALCVSRHRHHAPKN